MTESVIRSEGLPGRTRALATGFDGVPWPQFWRSIPALVVPQIPGVQRPIDPGAGWSASTKQLSAAPHPGWTLLQRERGISIAAPDGALWYSGCPLLTRDWRRAARTQQVVLLISGPFAQIDEFTAAASAGALRVLRVAVR